MGESPTIGKKPNYGIDAPGVVRMMLLMGLGGLALAALCFAISSSQPALGMSLAFTCFFTSISFLGTGLAMLWGSKYGKFTLRDRLLNSLSWSGNETVLDVGCGHGLLLIGAAKRLTTGKAIGVDIWQREDQAGNSPEATWTNARLEGVADRVDIRDGDARQLPFPENAFDVILSSWALHNIYEPAERKKALVEIVRVLKPGGHVAILDISHTLEYVQVFKEHGLKANRSSPNFLFVTPTHTVSASKAMV